MSNRLYDVPTFDGEEDYIADTTLDRLGAMLRLLPPHGFDLGHVQAHSKSVTATIKFDRETAPATTLNYLETMLEAACWARALHANLVAARESLSRPDVSRAADTPPNGPVGPQSPRPFNTKGRRDGCDA